MHCYGWYDFCPFFSLSVTLSLSEQYHFAPTGKSSQKSTSTTTTSSIAVPSTSLYRRAQNLFRTVPILSILCYEVLLSQGVSTLISYMFTTYTKQSIPQDHARASHTGKVYGRINFMSGVLQFAILPYVFGHSKRCRRRRPDDRDRSNGRGTNGWWWWSSSSPSPHHHELVDWYWLLLPSILGMAGMVMMMVTAESNLDIIVVGSSSTGYIRSWSRFDVVTLSFSIMKILEYSLRVALVERVRIEPNIEVNCARPVVLISNVAILFFCIVGLCTIGR